MLLHLIINNKKKQKSAIIICVFPANLIENLSNVCQVPARSFVAFFIENPTKSILKAVSNETLFYIIIQVLTFVAPLYKHRP
jgi:hypothetical protein